ncbi:DUF2958 domain-containing protein [Novosphingobium rosa]|uniref:DUF2958 domain-containing protein n=1 Tax=Novosphingobium rosa TaxID=76978 RepID=UPI00082D0983|nr:DUF2958 domain-containing protein [Novosphingobium rosa]
MILLPDKIRVALAVNRARHLAAQRDDKPEPDPVPLLKLFNPCGSATWLATELCSDGDTLFGIADLGFGCPELGYFSLGEIAAVRLPFNLSIERDLDFVTTHPLSIWMQTARSLGSIPQAEIALHIIGG